MSSESPLHNPANNPPQASGDEDNTSTSVQPGSAMLEELVASSPNSFSGAGAAEGKSPLVFSASTESAGEELDSDGSSTRIGVFGRPIPPPIIPRPLPYTAGIGELPAELEQVPRSIPIGRDSSGELIEAEEVAARASGGVHIGTQTGASPVEGSPSKLLFAPTKLKLKEVEISAVPDVIQYMQQHVSTGIPGMFIRMPVNVALFEQPVLFKAQEAFLPVSTEDYNPEPEVAASAAVDDASVLAVRGASSTNDLSTTDQEVESHLDGAPSEPFHSPKAFTAHTQPSGDPFNGVRVPFGDGSDGVTNSGSLVPITFKVKANPNVAVTPGNEDIENPIDGFVEDSPQMLPCSPTHGQFAEGSLVFHQGGPSNVHSSKSDQTLANDHQQLSTSKKAIDPFKSNDFIDQKAGIIEDVQEDLHMHKKSPEIVVIEADGQPASASIGTMLAQNLADEEVYSAVSAQMAEAHVANIRRRRRLAAGRAPLASPTPAPSPDTLHSSSESGIQPTTVEGSDPAMEAVLERAMDEAIEEVGTEENVSPDDVTEEHARALRARVSGSAAGASGDVRPAPKAAPRVEQQVSEITRSTGEHGKSNTKSNSAAVQTGTDFGSLSMARLPRSGAAAIPPPGGDGTTAEVKETEEDASEDEGGSGDNMRYCFGCLPRRAQGIHRGGSFRTMTSRVSTLLGGGGRLPRRRGNGNWRGHEDPPANRRGNGNGNGRATRAHATPCRRFFTDGERPVSRREAAARQRARDMSAQLEFQAAFPMSPLPGMLSHSSSGGANEMGVSPVAAAAAMVMEEEVILEREVGREMERVRGSL